MRKLTNSSELRDAIISAGFKYGYLAQALGITSYSLQKKIDNITEFKASEIKKLCELLCLDGERKDSIFFAIDCD